MKEEELTIKTDGIDKALEGIKTKISEIVNEIKLLLAAGSVPEWVQQLASLGKPIIEFFQAIVENAASVANGIETVTTALEGFLIIKSITSVITAFGKAISGFGLTKLLSDLGNATKAMAILGGIAAVVTSITSIMNSFAQSGMTLGEVAGLLGIVLGEVAAAFLILFSVMTILQPSWESIAGAAVILGGLVLVLGSICVLIETLSVSGLSLNEVIDFMSTVLLTIVGLMIAITTLGPSMTEGLVPFSVLVAEISAILSVMALTIPIILEAVGSFITTIAPSICTVLEIIGNLIEKIIYALGTVLPPIINSIGNLFTSIFNGISTVITSVGNALVKILEAIGNLVDQVLTSLLNFINNLGPAIENFVDSAISAVTKLINFMISGIEYLVNILVVDGVNAIIRGINSIGKYVGFTIPTLEKFRIERFKPTYMATGGIIDVPRRGVPLVANVIGGEAGAEGVLPLTNAATMQRLGQEIAKWIVLNIQLNNYIDGRLLCKNIKKIMNGQEFSRNGG